MTVEPIDTDRLRALPEADSMHLRLADEIDELRTYASTSQPKGNVMDTPEVLVTKARAMVKAAKESADRSLYAERGQPLPDETAVAELRAAAPALIIELCDCIDRLNRKDSP